MPKRGLAPALSRSAAFRAVALAIAAAALFAAPAARAQLRNVDLGFQPPSDTRVVGFHVYLASSSLGYGDYRDDINFIPPVDSSGVAHYALNGIEQFSDVYVSLRSYDANGVESAFSNELVVPAQQQCLVTGCNDNNPCTVDTCTSTGCKFDPAPVVGNTCDDGNAMTFNDVCQANGSCAGTPAQCNVDADCPAPKDACAGPEVCVAHTCQPGSSPLPDETACNDGNSTTRYDVCRSGVCRGFACGSDAQCSDGQACNGVERCVANACVAGTPMVCDDGNVCNGQETCVGSSCVAGTAMQCPADSGPCFDSFCDPSSGCRVQMHPDGSTCATAMSGAAGQCSAGVCVPVSTTPTDPNSTRDPRPTAVDISSAPCSTAFGPASDVRQELTSDPELERKIVWNAPLNPMGSLLQYQLSNGGPWRTLRAVPELQNGCRGTYSVTLGKLGTSFRYRVSGVMPKRRVWTDAFALRPGPAGPKAPFRFAFFAENGLQASAQSTQADNVLKQVRMTGAPLVLGGGGYALSSDAIADGAATTAAQAVSLWKMQARFIVGGALFAPVLGSSEVQSSVSAESAADYSEYLALATASQSYSYDFGGTHFVAVHAPDTTAIDPANSTGAAQLAWVDADLAAARARGVRWIVVYLHADLFSSEKTDASVSAVRKAFGAVLLKYGVNLVLSGEGDSYERTNAVRGNLGTPTVTPPGDFVTTSTDGVVFVRAGAGGRTVFGSWLRATPPNWSAFRDDTHAVYLQVGVSDKQLSLTAYGLDQSGKKSTLDSVIIR